MTDTHNALLTPEARALALLAQMTLPEKIGQMTQVEKNSLTPDDVRQAGIGSVLSGGGGNPTPNTPQAWREMVAGFERAALESRLGIPLLYGVDAVHGHNNVRGATMFPHNIGLGAAGDAQLVEQIGRATALEAAATGVRWNFAPMLAAPRDIRWGRTYEGYSADPRAVTELGTAYLRGLHGATPRVLATAKHFLGDGATIFGTSTMVMNGFTFLIDQGDVHLDEAELRAHCLPPYLAAIEAGVQTIMVSFNAWQGRRLHAHQYLLTDVLKGELGFSGFLVSDWQAIDQVAADFGEAVAASLNAGLDMVMVPFDFRRFMAQAVQAVESGRVPMARIDDAVKRILTVKFRLGLFDSPPAELPPLDCIGAAAHRALAREAVRRSLVLLKNDNGALPIACGTPLVFVGGPAADDIGLQCGGWTVEWLGGRGSITPGTSILGGLRQALEPETGVEFSSDGQFEGRAPLGVAVVAEAPYAEGMGDRADLTLAAEDAALIERMRATCDRLVVVLLSGRPLIITEQLPLMDALVAAWLPGSEAGGVADALAGESAFTGQLPYDWPRDMSQIPAAQAIGEPLFPLGFGLVTESATLS